MVSSGSLLSQCHNVSVRVASSQGWCLLSPDLLMGYYSFTLNSDLNSNFSLSSELDVVAVKE